MAQTAKAQKSYRVQFKFWLDLTRDLESMLADYCEELKTKRLFSSTIRDGIRLIRDLRAQRLDVLFELFPWLNAWIEERAEAIARTMIKSGHSGGGGEGNDPVIARLDRVEQLLITQSTSAGGGMLLAARENIRALPAGDDPTIEITQAKIDPRTNNPSYNFLISTAGLTGDFSGLPDEVIEYGLRIGRLDPKLITAPPSPKRTTSKRQRNTLTDEPPINFEDTQPTQLFDPIQEPPQQRPGNAKQMIVPALDAPSFDDFDNDDIGLFS